MAQSDGELRVHQQLLIPILLRSLTGSCGVTVWSFGVILSEMLSRRKPYHGKVTNEVANIVENVTVAVRDVKKRKANGRDSEIMPVQEDHLLGKTTSRPASPPLYLVSTSADLYRRPTTQGAGRPDEALPFAFYRYPSQL